MQTGEVSGAGRILGGRYRLIERIGSGGVADVWRAHDERLDRDVAVKLGRAGTDRVLRERSVREAARAAMVTHPNVVRVYDAALAGDQAFIVMELVDGASLDAILHRRGRLTLDESVAVIAQIAAALDAAHAAGLVHRDVKPANVLVDARGVAKLADFGVAASTGDVESDLVGTARYVAPERVRGDAPTPRSDVYALGLVAYEVLAGRPAFRGEDATEVLSAQLSDVPPPLRAVRPGTAAVVDAAVGRAIARDPLRRYASAGAFAAALARAAAPADRTERLEVQREPVLAPRALRRVAAAFTLTAFSSFALIRVAPDVRAMEHAAVAAPLREVAASRIVEARAQPAPLPLVSAPALAPGPPPVRAAPPVPPVRPAVAAVPEPSPKHEEAKKRSSERAKPSQTLPPPRQRTVVRREPPKVAKAGTERDPD